MNFKSRVKAKAKDTGKWVYGPTYLATVEDDALRAYVVLADPKHHPVKMEMREEEQKGKIPYMAVPVVEVEPETICRYAHMVDRGGNKIYENDYVEAYLDEGNPGHATRARIIFDEDAKYSNCDCAGWHMMEFGMAQKDGLEPFDQEFISQYKVIGNLFDQDKVAEEENQRFAERIRRDM